MGLEGGGNTHIASSWLFTVTQNGNFVGQALVTHVVHPSANARGGAELVIDTHIDR